MQSALHGRPAHDEMLFIIVHQAYELWFKQILWELDAVLATFRGSRVPEEALGQAVLRLGRIVEIQRVLIQQVDVLETMTPLDFLDFRDDLIPASGFQSVQFRLIENKLGMRRGDRLQLNDAPYTSRFTQRRCRARRGLGEGAFSLRSDRGLARADALPPLRRLRLLAGVSAGGRRHARRRPRLDPGKPDPDGGREGHTARRGRGDGRPVRGPVRAGRAGEPAPRRRDVTFRGARSRRRSSSISIGTSRSCTCPSGCSRSSRTSNGTSRPGASATPRWRCG